jgi:hypothetical protein
MTSKPFDQLERAAQLEEAMIDAYYLGHRLADIGGDEDFALAPMTRLAGSAVLSWARLVSSHMTICGTIDVAAQDTLAAGKRERAAEI